MNIIPIEYYTIIYYNIVLIIILFTWIHTMSHSGFTKSTSYFNYRATLLLFTFLMIYVGLRPVHNIFVDMVSYSNMYDSVVRENHAVITTDFGFYFIMKFLSIFNSKTLFFFVLMLLYILPLYIASKRWFPKYYFFAFLILIASFSFLAYGTNGLRNGIATSFMILAFSYMDKKLWMYLFFFIAFSFHGSVLLPIVAYFIVTFYRSYLLYFIIWVMSIFFSMAMGSFWESFFIKLGFGKEDKLLDYFKNKEFYKESFSHVGFRWDFLIYSATAVFIAYYFIYVKKFRDKQYMRLVNIYLITNAFWILVIRASFSNRFAYLSWFMMGIIISIHF